MWLLDQHICITWMLIRNADPQTASQASYLRISTFSKSPGWFVWTLKIEKRWYRGRRLKFYKHFLRHISLKEGQGAMDISPGDSWPNKLERQQRLSYDLKEEFASFPAKKKRLNNLSLYNFMSYAISNSKTRCTWLTVRTQSNREVTREIYKSTDQNHRKRRGSLHQELRIRC